ncbi:protein of unknown function [Chryseobacterium sp. JV274]|nr:protein of unknown function [Chryseobacterium sp. JV274]
MIKPIANGIFVVPMDKELVILEILGKKYPKPIPKNIAKNIHKVRNLSRNFNFGCIYICLINSYFFI